MVSDYIVRRVRCTWTNEFADTFFALVRIHGADTDVIKTKSWTLTGTR